MLSGQQDDRSWAGMNKVLDTIDGTAGFLEYSRDNFKKLADKLSGNDFKNSGEALKQIGNKYDATNSSYYGVTNPATGNSNYVIDMRKNFKNSLDSGMAALFLQREAYKTLLYNGLSLLSDQLSSETMNDIISSARGDVSEVREYIDDAKDFRDDMYDYTEKALDYWNLAKLILQAVYGVCVVAGIISLAALVLRSTFKKLKYVAKAFWGVIIVLVVAALLLTAVFFPVAVFVAESSDFLIYDDFIYNRDIIDKSLWNTISVCLVGDGNLDSVYNITDKLIFMRDIMEEFSIMDEIYAEGELKYVLNDEYIKSVLLCVYSVADSNPRRNTCRGLKQNIFRRRSHRQIQRQLQERQGSLDGEGLRNAKQANKSLGRRREMRSNNRDLRRQLCPAYRKPLRRGNCPSSYLVSRV
eukprot:TRINITY_DN2066_c0_g1_i2.p1 TRINITY_DN2066_c0_g1~~TRINITY_DN2066_c0_g1_i2.p1  ORF type:complete len:412 (+),score=46.35 TRINITY_DN2066_c0_g1_i2:723-1958(+)